MKWVCKCRKIEAQRKEGNVELKEARQEIAQKEAELAALQSQANEFKGLQGLLEGWETNTVSGLGIVSKCDHSQRYLLAISKCFIVNLLCVFAKILLVIAADFLSCFDSIIRIVVSKQPHSL